MKDTTPPGFPVLDTVTTTLNFFDARQPESNFRWTGSNGSERPMNLTTPDPHQVVIHDMRALSAAQREEMGLTLEKAGFEVVEGWGSGGEALKADWEQGKWNDESWIEGTYYEYVKRMISEKFNAKTVAIYDYTIRKRTTTDVPQGKDGMAPVAPAQQVHIDQTYWAAIGRIRLHLGEDAAQRVLSGASIARICNVWRPLVGPVYDRPLTAADFRSLDFERDFKETLPAPPGCRTGESQMVRFHPDQRWYYLSKMATNEALLLKCFDSGTGVRSPHSAFMDPTAPVDAEPRWSIEVRTISLVDVC
ncbi:hypothetical protein M413DRAFT_115299 [Hebeloma cylindrosporum]|uniref:Methyltransferase n=1 Tax=Hebeloma cylindrosporum TaxID=76867 RepID=A0A0C3D0V1_HEBCY|nr:hypothetical protein M413DRAFT_115299 [Hebeloma cylindrosporum h7]